MKIAAVFLVFAICLSIGADAADAPRVLAPPCDLRDFKDGAPIKLSRYKGKVVYLDFWASWCGPCAQSMPFMDDLYRQLQPKGLEVIAVNLDESREDANAFIRKHPIGIIVANNPGGECQGKFGVEVMPTSFLIDRQGKVRHVQVGFVVADKQAIRQQVDKLLAEK